jgi:hypothetical protein
VRPGPPENAKQRKPVECARCRDLEKELRELRSDLQLRTAEVARLRERHGDYD